MKKLILNLYFWPMFLLVTVIGLLAAPFLLVGAFLLPNRRIDRTIRQAIRIYGWVLIRIIPFMAPVILEDRSGGFETPVIFVPNHNSSVDPYLFGMIAVENAFVTSWPFHIPLYNFFMHLAGYINSNMGWQHVHRRGRELLDDGCSLIIWPEGHRSRTGRMGRFRNGAFKLALTTGRPIVPVCIVGSHQVLPPKQIFLNPARVRIILLPTIKTAGDVTNADDIKTLRDLTRKMIGEELDRHQVGLEKTITTDAEFPLASTANYFPSEN